MVVPAFRGLPQFVTVLLIAATLAVAGVTGIVLVTLQGARPAGVRISGDTTRHAGRGAPAREHGGARATDGRAGPAVPAPSLTPSPAAVPAPSALGLALRSEHPAV